MKWYRVVVRLGHCGARKGIEEERFCQASDCIVARAIAWRWGGVKQILEVGPLPPDHWMYHAV